MFKRLFKRGWCAPAVGEKTFSMEEAVQQQRHELLYVIKRARFTAFGEHYRFRRLLTNSDTARAFRKTVPLHTYRDIYLRWWYRPMNGETYVVWPGKIKYFVTRDLKGLKTNKTVPFSREMIKAVCKAGISASPDVTAALQFNGIFYEGNVAGIIKRHYPLTFNCCYPFNAGVTPGKSEPLLIDTGVAAVKQPDGFFRLLPNGGIYFEFLPLQSLTTVKGKWVLDGLQAVPLEEVEKDTDYLLVTSNRSGAWRYVPGDVIRFTQSDRPVFEYRKKMTNETD